MLNRGAWIAGWTALGLAVGVVAMLWITNAGTRGSDEMSRGISGSLTMIFLGCPTALVATFGGLAVGVLWNPDRTAGDRPWSRRRDPAEIGAWLGFAVTGALLAIGVVAILQLSQDPRKWVDVVLMNRRPYGSIAATTILSTGAAVGWWIGRRRRADLNFYRPGSTKCIRCGYDLVGTVDIECPECGHHIPFEQSQYLDRLQKRRQKRD